MTYHMTSVLTPPPYCSGFRAEIEVGAVDDDIISRHGCKKFVEVKLEKKDSSPLLRITIGEALPSVLGSVRCIC